MTSRARTRAHRLRALVIGALASLCVTSASAQAPVVVQPGQPGPVLGPPVFVVPGQPSRPAVVVPGPPRVVVEGTAICPPSVPCPPPCPAGLACPPPPCVCATPVIVTGTADVPAVVVTSTGALVSPDPTLVAPPTHPAPGTFGIGYLGTFDGTDVLHGGGLRFTGHLTDPWFIELNLGGQGAATALRDIGEFVCSIGPRVAAPLVPGNLRIYASLVTGIVIRSIGNMQTWGIWPVALGGGLELGAALDERWSLGAFIDVRGEARVPFERDPASVGLVWSGGLAFLWF